MPAVPPQVFAIDLGTSGVKAALVAADGTVTGWAQRTVPLHVLPGGGAEQDPRDWWQALVEVAGDLGRAHPDQLRAVTTVCSSTQGEGTTAVDAAGQPLTRCLTWLDMRGAPHLRRQFGGFPAYRGLSVRRMVRWLRLTGGMPSVTGKAVDRFLGAPVTSLVITGGGARSAAWCQIFADVLGVEVRRNAQPVAVNARGAGWIGAVGTGLLSFADVAAAARTDQTFTPAPAAHATYDDLFEVYQDLYRRLAPLYPRLRSPRYGSD